MQRLSSGEGTTRAGTNRGCPGAKMSAARRMMARMELYYRRLETPVGELLVAASSAGICRVSFPVEMSGKWYPWFDRYYGAVPRLGPHPFLQMAEVELAEYFARSRRYFEVPLDLKGTPFQQEIWRELQAIPYGWSISYGELARRVGKVRAARAVGNAVGDNPVPILVPCHRVLGWDGQLVGFGGGLEMKERLLELEGARIPFGR